MCILSQSDAFMQKVQLNYRTQFYYTRALVARVAWLCSKSPFSLAHLQACSVKSKYAEIVALVAVVAESTMYGL